MLTQAPLRREETTLVARPVTPIGGVLGNAIVIGVLAASTPQWVGWIGLPVAVPWLEEVTVPDGTAIVTEGEYDDCMYVVVDGRVRVVSVSSRVLPTPGSSPTSRWLEPGAGGLRRLRSRRALAGFRASRGSQRPTSEATSAFPALSRLRTLSHSIRTEGVPAFDARAASLLASGMRHLDAPRLLLVSALALAATQALAIDSPTPSSNGAPGAGSCVIVDYTVKAGDGYTWYYCPSSRVFIRPGQRWVTNLDKGVETGVLEQERKVRTQPLSVKHEQQRAATGRDSAPSFTATGKTDVIAGVTAEEHIVKVNFRGQPSEVHQWFAKDLRTPGQEKAMAWVIDKDTARKVPPGVFLRDDDREATGVRKGEPPAAVLAIPADYEKQHWSKEKNGWVDGE